MPKHLLFIRYGWATRAGAVDHIYVIWGVRLKDMWARRRPGDTRRHGVKEGEAEREPAGGTHGAFGPTSPEARQNEKTSSVYLVRIRARNKAHTRGYLLMWY